MASMAAIAVPPNHHDDNEQAQGLRLGITTGNPGVFPGNLYPYLSKPTPVTMGRGFHGSG